MRTLLRNQDGGCTRVWKDIPSYAGIYEASSEGLIRNKRTGRTLRTHLYARHTSVRVKLYDGHGKGATRSVHSVIAEAFLGPRPDGYQINHMDGDRTNNAANNLEYVTPKENMAHAWATGLMTDAWAKAQPKGADSPRAKFTWEEVTYIREQASSGVRRSELTREHRISKGHLSQILNFRIYKTPDAG